MSNPTIDLSKDLEAFYDFDTRYWDPQRNELKDQSGYARHTEAVGGPSIGVQSVDDWEAAAMDGIDDRFDCPTSLGVSGAQTLLMYIQNGPQGWPRELFDNIGTNDGTKVIQDDPGDLFVRIYDGAGTQQEFQASAGIPDETGLVGFIYDGSEVSVVRNSTVDTVGSLASNSPGTGNATIIGNDSGGNDAGEYNLIWFFRASRAINEAEFKYLTKSTSLRRAML
jgi:hypothetical protein